MIRRTAAMSRFFVSLLIAAVCPLLLPASAAAVNVFSTGFESGESYVIGDLDGQDGWSDGPALAVPIVQTGTVLSGTQALQIDGTGFSTQGDLIIAAGRGLNDPTGANPLVTISVSVRLTSDEETHYGIATYDGTTQTNCVEFKTNDSPSNPDDILLNGTSTGQRWYTDVGTWVTLELVLDFSANLKVADLSYKGTSIADDIPFLNDGNLAGFAILTNDGWLAGGSSMFVDNLSITAVPEPGSAALLGVCAAAVLWKRRRT